MTFPEHEGTSRTLPLIVWTFSKVGMISLEELIKEFISILEIEEKSDSGKLFYPNRISSCRAMDGKRMNELLIKMKETINA